ncbi:MAG: Txe/YoeB family addiction module toxin [Gammaproteobacteria bacterium]
MNLCFTPEGWDDYLYWQQHDKKLLVRINDLIKDIQRTPFQGIGKPEPLKHSLRGCWSRRIDAEHRLVYSVKDGTLVVLSARFHY